MCGIAGFFNPNDPVEPDERLIRRMVAALRHRGPDEAGAYLSPTCCLGQARLSIIDLAGGSQPMTNEDGNLWITFNGEIFNYLELKRELVARGHLFRTDSDTEVLLHAFEEWGTECLHRLNGQFAFAILDRGQQSIFLARDRMGIRPLFYARHQGRFYFASESKAIFCDPLVARRLDPAGLDQVFTWWATVPPRTAFEGISELAPGCWMRVDRNGQTAGRYWSPGFPSEFDRRRSAESWAEELHAALVDSVRLRLRADVPVGAYLSGGLDSSATTALIKYFTDTPVETFSVAFRDAAFDESDYQEEMASHLGTRHHRITCSRDDIAEDFPAVVYHAEKPLVRTAPTPLLMLSKLVRENDFKVVLTGEGSDEVLGGYDIFKETLIRRFWARRPDSRWRALLLKRLYRTLPLSPGRARFYLETFYRAGLEDPEAFNFSHLPRINTTSKVRDYYSSNARSALAGNDSVADVRADLPDEFTSWHHLSRAQYLEMRTLLSGYLLSSQGDRVAAANAVEGRFPFLDHRVVELASRIPPWLKLRGLNEKFILKKAMQKELPRRIVDRVKQPYMAPDSNSFFGEKPPEYVAAMLSEEALLRSGLFDFRACSALREKCRRLSHKHLSFKDNMSFISILSTQLLHHQYVERFDRPEPLPRSAFAVWHREEALPVSPKERVRRRG